jgi:extracellular factor (EF) 3-hydroxypalmitic acid methyl ester biosynthesis protein
MRLDSNPLIAVHPSAQESLSGLYRSVTRFLDLEESEAGGEEMYHLVLERVHRLCGDIVRCERAGYSREEIVDVLQPVRSICNEAPFVKRLQEWPRGYPGDFETIEHLCSGENKAAPGTIASFCEQFSLTRSIAQQHRNKVQHQARQITRAIVDSGGHARIFSIASGSCPDFRSIPEQLEGIEQLWLNDGDTGALEFSARALHAIRDRCHFRPGNALKVARRAVQNGLQFHLVLAGGLFDYLPDNHATYLIEQAWHLLANGGTFFFTNIARGNPYRPLIEYFGDWFLIERSEDDIRRLCVEAGVPPYAISIRRDETGLALLVEVRNIAI